MSPRTGLDGAYDHVKPIGHPVVPESRVRGGEWARANIITFGPFQLDMDRRLLIREGHRVTLGSQSLDILLALVESAGAPVRKEDLIARVWPGIRDAEAALRIHVAALRKVLRAGRPDSEDFVNIPGRGYKFTAPITRPNTSGSRWHEIEQSSQFRHLPLPSNRVFGREDDVATIIGRIGTERCVTVTGTGGIGKTTIGLVVGHKLAPQFKDGTFFVDLAPLSAGMHVIEAIAAAAGLSASGLMSVERLASILSAKDVLLLADNCEHLAVDAADVIAKLTSGDSRVRVLATSREPLRFAGEHVYRLPTLKTPELVAGITAEEAIRFPAVQLFVERAAASTNHFILEDANAFAISMICGQLDGLALAIEMAATRMDTFGVADIAGMLDDRFRMLRQTRRDSSPRHASLAATLDWSYEMLSPDQRKLLHRVAAFSGRFTLDDVLKLVKDDVFKSGNTIELLADLVDKSFLMVDLSGPHAFYRSFETIREYARQKSQQAGEFEDSKHRHASYIARLFHKADEDSESRNSADWLNDYGRYIDDVRSAIDWLMAMDRDLGAGISLTASAVTLWTHLSLLNELHRRTEFALATLGANAEVGSAREMKLFAALSYALVNLFGPTRQGTNACRAALEIARRLGDHSSEAKALLALWNGCFANGEVRASLELAEQFMVVAPKLGAADVFVGHRLLGSSLFYLGDVAGGRENMEIMVAGYGRTAHDAHMARFGFGQLASGRGLLAFHLCYQGLFDQGMEATRQSAREAIASNHAMTACGVLGTTSIPNAICTGHLAEARAYLEVLYQKARSHGLERWENFACGFDGIITVKEGDLVQGLAKLTLSVSRADDRANTRYTFIFSEQALALGLSGDPIGGLAAIDEILDRLVNTGERWYLPELYRCRARLLQMSGARGFKVEASFLEALSLADELNALTWRLQATKDYAEWLRSRGQRSQGTALLRKALAAFSEGLDSPTCTMASDLLRTLESDGDIAMD
jgi:predicted ATPase/DNA-binding winged helix-turn-helix (wHTH) protein